MFSNEIHTRQRQISGGSTFGESHARILSGMAALLGARDIGLDTHWSFGFVGNGSRASTTPGVVYLDVGGNLAPGVLDHHDGGNSVGSASGLVNSHAELIYNHLLTGWLHENELGRIIPGTKWAPRVVTHFNPDWDCIVATHLTVRLIEDGGLPSYADAITAYAREVDQGRARVDFFNFDSFLAPHLCYLMIQHHHAGRHDVLMQRGLALLERVIRDVSAAKGDRPWSPALFSGYNPAATAWRGAPEYTHEWTRLSEEPDRFSRDLKQARILEEVLIPSSDGHEPLQTRAFVATRPLESALGKYFIRALGYELSVIPLAQSIAQSGDSGAWEPGMRDSFPRVVISVDPVGGNMRPSHPNLRGLGYALEKAESAERRARHGGLDDRGGAPRWKDGSCDNGDPWYDGRGHAWTILDSPRVGTVLRYEEILRILTETQFWERPLQAGMVALVWVEKTSHSMSPSATPLPVWNGISETLLPLYADSREATESGPAIVIGGATYAVKWRRRRFPDGTAPNFRIAILEAGLSATLEGLIAAGLEIQRTVAFGPPTYTFARISLVPYASSEGPLEAQMDRLGLGTLTPADLKEGNDLVLFNARSLVLEGPPPPGLDGDMELLLYVAFLNEALVGFSKRIGEKVPQEIEKISLVDTREIRRDMLRFQARYFQMEVSRRSRGRRLFEVLFESSRLSDHYQEVQYELSRLAEIEQASEDERAAKADRALELVLYVVAVLGVYQTVIAFVTMDRTILKARWFITTLSAISLVAVAVYGFIAKRRASRP